MVIALTVTCPSCSSLMCQEINTLTPMETPTVDVMCFEQSDWRCMNCDKSFSIGEIAIDDIDDL